MDLFSPKMNGTRSKGKTAKVPKLIDEKTTLNGDLNSKAKGHNNANGGVAKRTEPSENIFLFYPNIIGV